MHTYFERVRSPRVWMAAAYAIGWFASAYLLYVYITGGPIACGATHGCDVVRASSWAYVGPIPQPLFGVAFYTGMLTLLVARSISASREKTLWRLIQIGAVFGFLESLLLFFVQWLDVRAFCTWCLVSGVAATIGCMMMLLDKERLTTKEREADLLSYTIVLLALAGIGMPMFLWLVGAF